MSLFERIKNKRYDLQEAPIDDKGNITPEPGEVKKSKEIVKKFVNKQKRIEKKNIKTNTQKGDKLLQNINQRKSADLTRADAYNRAYGTSGSSTEGAGGANTGTTPKIRKTKITGNVIPKKDLPKTKGVNQADVSKQAKDFTKKINKERIVKQGNIFGGQDKVKPKTKVGSTTPRGTRTINKKFNTPGQQKLDLGGDVTKKTPTPRLSKSGEIVTDLRTVQKKPRTARKRSPLAKTPKPEKMVVVKDPVKGGFKKVGATTTQGREVLKKKKFVSTDELLGNKKKIVSNTKNTSKPNLFSRATSKLKNIHKGIVKDAGFRKTASKNLTKNVFKNTLGGNTMRVVNKILPGKYKALASIAVGTGAYLATRGKKKDGGGGGGGSIGKTAIKPSVSRKSINLSKPNAPNA